MYYFLMDKQKLKKILLKHFKDSTVDALLRGSRYPSMTKAIIMHKQDSVPVTAWIDIVKWLEKEEKKATEEGEQPIQTEKAS